MECLQLLHCCSFGSEHQPKGCGFEPLPVHISLWPRILQTGLHIINHVIHVVGGSSMIGFALIIAESEQDMLEIKSWALGWHTSTLTTELQEVRKQFVREILGPSNY